MFSVERISSRIAPSRQILALGTDTCLKISWSKDGCLYSLRPAAGGQRTATFYRNASRHLVKKFKLKPVMITYDPHPFFYCGLAAREIQKDYFPKTKLQPVAHHKAHVANFGIEAGVGKKFIGLAWDGSGYGQDGGVWGGEFFFYDTRIFRRVARFAEQELVGNEAAIREPWRVAFAILYRLYGPKALRMPWSFLRKIPRDKIELLRQMIDKDFNTAKTSSVGRLFDAAAALLNIKTVVKKEAEAAVALEKAAAGDCAKARAYPFGVSRGKDGCLVVDVLPMFGEMVKELRRRRPTAEIAYCFHQTLASVVVSVGKRLQKRFGANDVYCSGGVFMNKILVRMLTEGFGLDKLRISFAQRPLTTDLGISQGQIAACVMENIVPCA